MSIVEVVRKTTTVVEVAHPGVQGVPGAVDSVNSRTGAVVLTSADVGGQRQQHQRRQQACQHRAAAADAAVLASANATHGRTPPARITRIMFPPRRSALGNVENKSSATIRSEITSGNVAHRARLRLQALAAIRRQRPLRALALTY